MSTPANAPYKLAQQYARSISMARFVYYNITGKPAQVIRDGKLNKKSGRRLATRYK